MHHHLIAFLFLGFFFSFGCGGDDTGGGNCSISCGGFGTGQPFVQTNHPFVSEAECIQLGMERSGGCKASYCPPTGDPDDCYQVYP